MKINKLTHILIPFQISYPKVSSMDYDTIFKLITGHYNLVTLPPRAHMQEKKNYMNASL